ncbi:MAG: HAMP domain-containing histidine kinase [Cyclobacteriaceae bacterium]|nr:HAMP domain-containing histidine kinase [Cyclobacteriaceae bacterium]
MRLSYKMILFNLLSKGVILLVFFSVGPYLLKKYALDYTDDRLLEKRSQVLEIIADEGIENFFQDDPESGYGSYNLLKEEYISLERIVDNTTLDTIFNEERIIEEDVVSYRVLAYTFQEGGNTYLLEIGRSLATIQQIEKVISSLIVAAFFIFIGITIIMDTSFHGVILRPFNKIIYKKIPEIREPSQYTYEPIKTGTKDFKILDEAINSLTPISVIQSKIENMLSESHLSPEELQRLMDMQQTIQRFKHLVNSLLLISKISNAQYVKNEMVDLCQVVQEVIETWEPVAREKGLNFSVEADVAVPIANSNYSMVLMMIQNAVINAIRYTTAPGSVSLTISQREHGAVVEVTDTGNGIPTTLIDQVKRGHVFLTDAKNDKSGFGLQIMHRIATFLNVDLTIDSTDKGTIIRFDFGKDSVSTA